MTGAILTFVEELLRAARVVLPVVVAGAAGVRRHAQYGSLADLQGNKLTMMLISR